MYTINYTLTNLSTLTADITLIYRQIRNYTQQSGIKHYKTEQIM